MTVVSDTTALSCLFKIDRLDLLYQFSDNIIIPQAVWQELSRLPHFGYDISVLQNASWLSIEPANNTVLIAQLNIELDVGESEAIALALEKKADYLLIDEKEGRAKAELLRIPTIGLVGILLTLKENQLIKAVKPVLDDLREHAGFYLSDSFYSKILERIGE